MKTVIALLIGCIGMGQAVKAQSALSYSREKADSLVNPPVMKEAENLLRFDKTVLNIGTLTEDDAPKTYRFTCTNVSGKPLVLTRVKTTCGCTSADVQTGEIKPGETRSIGLTYHPKNHPGTVDANAFVYLSASDKTPAARLTLTGNVLPGADEWARYPYAMGKLRLKQNRMEFKEMTPQMRPSERILCGNSGDKPLKLSALMIPKFAGFRTEPETIPPGGEADIVVTVDGSLIPEEKGDSFTFPIILEGVDARPSDRTLKVTVHIRK